jgi:hypothetical protein
VNQHVLFLIDKKFQEIKLQENPEEADPVEATVSSSDGLAQRPQPIRDSAHELLAR